MSPDAGHTEQKQAIQVRGHTYKKKRCKETCYEYGPCLDELLHYMHLTPQMSREQKP
jgi:hypothetical protein